MTTKTKTTTKKKMTKRKAGGLTGAPATEKQRLDAIRDIERSGSGTSTFALLESKSPEGGRTRKAATGGKTVKTSKAAHNGRKPGILTIAAMILASSKEPLDCKALVAEAQAQHGWVTRGKTPYSTLYAAITREIAAKGDEARFIKTDRSRFAANRKEVRPC